MQCVLVDHPTVEIFQNTFKSQDTKTSITCIGRWCMLQSVKNDVTRPFLRHRFIKMF